MLLNAIAFYLFSPLCWSASSLARWSWPSRNPVHAVLFLILAFFNAAGLFVLLGAEFLAMILVVVYVGAVAVLFLFVVMMLDIDFADLQARARSQYLPVGSLLALLLIAELVMVPASVVKPTASPLARQTKWLRARQARS